MTKLVVVTLQTSVLVFFLDIVCFLKEKCEHNGLLLEHNGLLMEHNGLFCGA